MFQYKKTVPETQIEDLALKTRAILQKRSVLDRHENGLTPVLRLFYARPEHKLKAPAPASREPSKPNGNPYFVPPPAVPRKIFTIEPKKAPCIVFETVPGKPLSPKSEEAKKKVGEIAKSPKKDLKRDVKWKVNALVRDLEDYTSPQYGQKRKFVNQEEDRNYLDTLKKLEKMHLSVEVLRTTKVFQTLQEIEANASLIPDLKNPAVQLLVKWRAKLNSPKAVANTWRP